MEQKLKNLTHRPVRLMLTMMDCLYFLGFKAAYDQNIPLHGEEGLVPAKPIFDERKEKNKKEGKSLWDLYFELPVKNLRSTNIYPLLLRTHLLKHNGEN